VALYTFVVGMRAVDESEAVVHVSYYEADAFAAGRRCGYRPRTSGKRAAQQAPAQGHFADGGRLPSGSGAPGLFGDVWQWTQSTYEPTRAIVPHWRRWEYNAKFMCNQMVLRGGSCFTPRATCGPRIEFFRARGALAGERHPARA